MMNLVALSLVMASLAAAGVFSPTPQAHQNHAEKTIIKEGHRVVVVEFDQDGHHNTKISITPDQPHDNKLTDVADYSGKENIREAASVLPNMGQGLSQGPEDRHGAFLHAPKELICDAYGRCKHRIAEAMGKAKETAKEAIDTRKEEAREVGETVADAVSQAKDTVSQKAHDVQEKAKGTMKQARDTAKEAIDTRKQEAREVGETVADVVGKARDTVSHKAHDVQDKAKDTGNTLRNDISGNVSEAMKSVRNYLGSRETLHHVMGVSNLMGFATAYGLCVWVTFVSSYVLSRAMPRQQFGVVQSKIYPVYFRTMAYSVGLALLGHVLRHRNTLFFSEAGMLQAYNLLASLLTLFVNSIYLEPRATKVMFERTKIEKEEGRGRGDFTTEPGKAGRHPDTTDTTKATTTSTGTGSTTRAPQSPAPTREAENDVIRSRIIELNDKLKRLNSYSSLLNILNLMSLTWHLVYLAQCLHHNC